MAKQSDTMRDKTRAPHAKLRSMSRRKARHVKSAALFLAWAFASPADLSGFSPLAR
ncbi:MAG: hypothetical protein ABW128_07060 [Rhizorhabdus sp.]